MFSKHGRYKDTRPFDNVVTGRCFARMLSAALFLFMALHAGAARAGDGFGERFGDRAWAGWCEGRADLGWNFYCDPEEERRKAEEAARLQATPKQPAETLDPEPPTPETPPEPSAVETIDGMRAHLDELRAAAILRPSDENLEAYMRAQARFTGMAGDFAAAWRRVLWARPDLDYEAVHPQGNLAKKAAQADLFTTRQRMMAGLNQRYGLIYVGTSQCPVCTIYGPHLRRFAGRWKLTTLAVSADGTPLTGWPEAVPDRGQLARMRVTRRIVPLTALFETGTRKVTLLGVGFLSDDELVHRIHTLTTPEDGDAF